MQNLQNFRIIYIMLYHVISYCRKHNQVCFSSNLRKTTRFITGFVLEKATKRVQFVYHDLLAIPDCLPEVTPVFSRCRVDYSLVFYVFALYTGCFLLSLCLCHWIVNTYLTYELDCVFGIIRLTFMYTVILWLILKRSTKIYEVWYE